MHYFCTYCDQGYAARLLCLRDSLRASGERFRLYVLCFDAQIEAVVRGEHDDSLWPIPLAQMLAADPAYAAVQSQRTRYEFYFTASPVVVRYCLQLEPTAEQMTYLDADLCFFAPPAEVFAQQGDASVAIVPHRFSPPLLGQMIYGTFNVGWVSFRRDQQGLACLDWWRERCLEWCHDCVDQGRYADQGYLNEFPRRFQRVTILDHPGINAAPWNMMDAKVSREGDQILVNGRLLLFYHYQGIREVVPGWFDLGLGKLRSSASLELKNFIYAPYLKKLVDHQGKLQREYGIAPLTGYHRQHTGRSLRAWWERVKGRWLLPTYRRMSGQLVPCSESPLS